MPNSNTDTNVNTIRIILIRHGERERSLARYRDHEEHLTGAATNDARRLARRFAALSITPKCILTSTHVHAIETAEILALGLKERGTLSSVQSLTPALKTPPWYRISASVDRGSASTEQQHWADEQLFDDLSTVFRDTGGTIFLVGHHPRLDQLVVRFTGQRQRQLGALEAICVSAESFQSLWLGCGAIEWRYPVRNWLEDELRDKLTSKMTVATFLASANFVALFEILINKPKELIGRGDFKPTVCEPAGLASAGERVHTWCLFQPYLTPVSFLLLALAAGLFIVAVYLYDRLGMPSGFWLLKRPWWVSRDKAEQLHLNGYPQAHMVRIWTHVFTPAVICSASGVTLLVISTGSRLLTLAFVVVCIGSYWMFLRLRPIRDAD